MACKRPLRLAAIAGVAGLATIALSAADHRDGPIIIGNSWSQQDINDLYVFQAPQTPGDTVMIMTTNPMAGVMGPTSFLSNARYELLIDIDDDAHEDLVFRVTFSQPGRTGEQAFTVTNAAASIRARGLVGQTVPILGGGRMLAGVFDDPFFLDRIAAQQSMSFCENGAINFFRGLNVNAIVLQVPHSMLGSRRIGVWSRIVWNGGQVDRVAHPSLNTLLIPESRRDEFNRREPEGDEAFRFDVVTSLVALGNNQAMASSIADALLPDLVRFDAAVPDGFPNGRRLIDDVIDLELAEWTNGRVTTDCVGSDSAFSTAFPYLAPANP